MFSSSARIWSGTKLWAIREASAFEFHGFGELFGDRAGRQVFEAGIEGVDGIEKIGLGGFLAFNFGSRLCFKLVGR